MNFVRYSCLLALGAAACLAQTVPATITKTSGMVGITQGETARLNLLNPGVAISPASGATTSVSANCSAAVAFFDGAGNNLKSTTVSVPPGQSVGFDLHSDTDLGLAAGDRKEIRAVVTLPAVPGATSTSALAPACKLIPTLEIFDSLTLRTLVVLGRAEVVP